MIEWTPGFTLNEDQQEQLLHTISEGFLSFVMEAQASWLSSPHGGYMERHEGSVNPLYVSALVSPEAKTIEKIIPKKFWSGETAQDQADEIQTALSVNGDLANPSLWPHETLRQVTSYVDRHEPYELCKEDIGRFEQEEIIDFATMLISMSASVQDKLAQEMGDEEDLVKAKAIVLRDRMDEVELEAKELAPDFKRMISEEYYDKWWDIYGEKGTSSDRCVSFYFISEIGIWTKK